MEKTATIPVYGMSCEHCVKAVVNALNALNGVKNVEVSLEGKSTKVVYDEELTGLSELESAIIEEGYQVKEG
jgi:copper ion binding protein